MTVLHHPVAPLVKTWVSSTEVNPYGLGKHFTVESVPIDSFSDLVSALLRLEDDPSSAVIRGTYPAGAGERVQRTTLNFEDRPLYWILIEVDAYEPLCADPVTDPAVCVSEYVGSLPACFHRASYHWQLSNSAGLPKHVGKLKAHLWFWLETPYTSVELRTWAKVCAVPCDAAVFNLVQLHYTGAPIFAPGVVDPVSVRSGTVMTDRLSVPLVIDPAVLETARASVRAPRPALEGGVSPDPVAAFLTRTGQVLGKNNDGDLCVRCPLQDLHGQGTEGDTSTVWLIAGGANYEQGHFKCSHTTNCSALGDPEFLEACGYLESFTEGFDVLPPLMVNGFNHATGQPALVVVPEKPTFELNADKTFIKAKINNVFNWLKWRAECGQWIRFDAFRDEIVLSHPLAPSGSRAFTDADYTRLCRKAEEGLGAFTSIPHDMMRRAVHNLAEDAMFDSARDWILHLPPWDGVDRLTGFMATYLGAVTSTPTDTDYASAVGYYLWSAMAGRILDPGSQTDMVVILVSPQGTGKSSAVRAIAPHPSYYTEICLSDSDADRARLTRGKTLVELSELRGLHTKDLESIKAIVTRREDSWTPKYMEMSTTYRRRYLMIGTTNDSHFLADPTGARRWLPIHVGLQDVPALHRDHTQLWAQARDLYHQHKILWKGAQTLALTQHDDFTIQDAWEYDVDKYLRATLNPGVCDYVQIAQILQVGLDMRKGQSRRSDEMRIAAILRKWNFTVRRTREGKVLVSAWYPPESWNVQSCTDLL